MLYLTEIAHGNQFHIYALGHDTNCPFLEFAEEIQATLPNEWPKLIRLIDKTKDTGPIYNEQQSKKLEGYDLCEFRTRGGLRVFYFFDTGKLVICANGYVKHGDSTPRRELQKADSWRKAYLAAKQKNELKFSPNS